MRHTVAICDRNNIYLLLTKLAIAHALRFYIAHATTLVLFVLGVGSLKEEYL